MAQSEYYSDSDDEMEEDTPDDPPDEMEKVSESVSIAGTLADQSHRIAIPVGCGPSLGLMMPPFFNSDMDRNFGNENASPELACDLKGKGGKKKDKKVDHSNGAGGDYGDGESDDEDDSRNRNNNNAEENLTLSSVGGLDEHINFLRLAVMYPLKHSQAMKEWGVEPPKGIMFHGAPGTGKTMLAKALGNEISAVTGKKVTFFYHRGSESFSMWVGQTEAALRQLFAKAVASKPSIIFFDEIDGLCPNRESAQHSGQVLVNVVTAMLGLIDSVKRGEVLIIGATNRLNAVDPAIRRPGRFDKDLFFPLPNEAGRKSIMNIHTSMWLRDRPSGELLQVLAKRTIGFSGADLKKLCNDTVKTAMIRSGTGTMHVLEGDWGTAFSSMNKSSTNVYGSSLYVSEPVSPLLTPLLTKGMQKVIPKLEMFLPHGEISTLPIKMFGTHSFLLRDDDVATNDRYHLDLIVKGVLNHSSINNYPTFLLDFAAINKALAKNSSGSVSKVVEDLIGQIVHSRDPCILYVPEINLIYNAIKGTNKEKGVSVFLSQLKKIHGPNKILLASWIGPIVENPDNHHELLHLFHLDHACYRLKAPSGEERRHFFGQLLPLRTTYQPDVKKKGGNKKMKILNKEEKDSEFLEQIVTSTQGDRVRWLVDLYAALHEANKVEGTEARLRTILENYETNKGN